MVEVNLGAIRFNWRGAYAGGTAYVADDVVSSGGSSYICILASTGNAVSNTTYWSQMSAAGTDGTDLTSTLTTQGDVLYRDGSGLQRLAKGTAAQVLSVNSGATAPEWADAAGGMHTLITTQTLSSAASSASFTSNIDSTYKTYLIRAEDVEPTTDAVEMFLYVSIDGGSSWKTADYEYHIQRMQGSSGSEAHSNHASDSKLRLTDSGVGNHSFDSWHANIYLFNPSDTANLMMIQSDSMAYAYNAHAHRHVTGGAYEGTTAAINGIKISPSSGTMTGIFKLYGLS